VPTGHGTIAGVPDGVVTMTEEPLQFGDGGRLFGILTRSDANAAGVSKDLVFVFINAGLLHRPGPHRMHVRLARELATKGIHSLRFDIGGLGDSLAAPGILYPESVAVDFADVLELLESEFPDASITLFGLCAGADNAIRLAIENPQVRGMVLLDPVCDRDDGFENRQNAFAAQAFKTKAATPSRYVPYVRRRVQALTRRDSADKNEKSSTDSLSLRALPTTAQTIAAFEALRDREGRVLSIFTSYALRYYNEQGQMGRVLGIDAYDSFCSEVFWPHARHTYPLETHRLALIEKIVAWAVRQAG